MSVCQQCQCYHSATPAWKIEQNPTLAPAAPHSSCSGSAAFTCSLAFATAPLGRLRTFELFNDDNLHSARVHWCYVAKLEPTLGQTRRHFWEVSFSVVQLYKVVEIREPPGQIGRPDRYGYSRDDATTCNMRRGSFSSPKVNKMTDLAHNHAREVACRSGMEALWGQDEI